jgi:hypothetical protein
MKKYLVAFVIGAVLAGITGCMSNGTPPPRAEAGAAVLFTNGSFWNVPKANMRMVSIDGRETNVRQASLSAGQHHVQVEFRTHDLNGFADMPCELSADRVYEISAEKATGRHIKVTLEEIQNDKRKEIYSFVVMGVPGP